MAEGLSLVNFGDISKPAVVLIEKISDALGGYFKPYQIRRIAKAGGEAKVIEAHTQMQITKIQRRALARFLAEEAKKQDNIESITRQAVPLLGDSSNPQDVNNDWIANFFDKCRIVSDKEMQLLWARILAGEANSPGSYSKRTVNFLGSVEKREAELFATLCGFAWTIEEFIPLIYHDLEAAVYAAKGITFSTLLHLDDIGLISYTPNSELGVMKLPQRIVVYYYRTPLAVEFSNSENNQLNVGQVILTNTGKQLAGICEAKPVDGFYDYVIHKWAGEGLVLSSPYPREASPA